MRIFGNCSYKYSIKGWMLRALPCNVVLEQAGSGRTAVKAVDLHDLIAGEEQESLGNTVARFKQYTPCVY